MSSNWIDAITRMNHKPLQVALSLRRIRYMHRASQAVQYFVTRSPLAACGESARLDLFADDHQAGQLECQPRSLNPASLVWLV
jgi:hypothetical protein